MGYLPSPVCGCTSDGTELGDLVVHVSKSFSVVQYTSQQIQRNRKSKTRRLSVAIRHRLGTNSSCVFVCFCFSTSVAAAYLASSASFGRRVRVDMVTEISFNFTISHQTDSLDHWQRVKHTLVYTKIREPLRSTFTSHPHRRPVRCCALCKRRSRTDIFPPS